LHPKGGADIHPAWYFNIQDSKDLEFQIATQAFRGAWLEPEGAEYEAVWDFMEKLYPPYRDYRAATNRKIRGNRKVYSLSDVRENRPSRCFDRDCYGVGTGYSSTS
jgi:hypothetical protein